METNYWQIDQQQVGQSQAIEQAAALLQQQQVVAFPTETVYGLGADATSKQAVDKIFQAKGRPADNPLIVHIANREQIKEYVTSIPAHAEKLIEAFMPGPLTVILEHNGTIAKNVTAGLSTVGIRMPDHPVARRLIEVSGLPLAAPSANQSGKPSPTTAKHVYDDLNGRVAGIVDGGPTGVGVESTVLDCTQDIPVILRPGGITKEELEEVLGTVMLDPALAKTGDKPRAPGMKYTHYEPEAPLWLVKGDAAFFQAKIDQYREQGYKVGVMVSKELATQLQAETIKVCGSQADLTQVAVQLYDTLRAFKISDVDIILCESFPEQGVGQAVMNRLTKASSRIVRN
ncbi:L-threonylcarbamoyladenylate synthase [Aquibacillus sediminis]|uniref:L-threonylcarbamoyladenylate synthase n=1 Tax=Aquibacillus sediminis TaxID=2574734 RepID=UPI001108D948